LKHALLCLALLGCGVPAGVVTPATAAKLDVHTVDWNPRHERITDVTGALDFGSDVVVFSKSGATILTDGIATLSPGPGDLHAGAIVPAPDGSGSWITALDGQGRVFRLRARRTFEPVSDRYGLQGKHVQSLAGFGGQYVAFGLGDDVAVADGASVTHYGVGPGSLVAGGLFAWIARPHELAAVDPRTRSSHTYTLDDPRVAVDASGHVYVASGRAIYEETPPGHLTLRYMASSPIDTLVASNDHVWFTDGGELGVIGHAATGASVSRTQGAKLEPSAKLMGSLSGDVWSIDSRGALTRWAMGPSVTNAARGAWSDVVAPVFARSCAGCHGPEGSAGIDLSTESAWRIKRDLLRQRLVSDHDMPPQGHALSDGDRAALGAYLR
jgi:mono/diheme cytochrome c family protein